MTSERRTGLPSSRPCAKCGAEIDKPCVETFIAAGEDGKLEVKTRTMLRHHPIRSASVVLDVSSAKAERSKRK